MRLLLDQPLSRKLVPLLQGLYPESSHVLQHGLGTATDETIWEFAKASRSVVVTKDEDFQVLSFARGHPPKVVWLRSGNGPSTEVLQILVRAHSMMLAFDVDLERSLLVLP